MCMWGRGGRWLLLCFSPHCLARCWALTRSSVKKCLVYVCLPLAQSAVQLHLYTEWPVSQYISYVEPSRRTRLQQAVSTLTGAVKVIMNAWECLSNMPIVSLWGESSVSGLRGRSESNVESTQQERLSLSKSKHKNQRQGGYMQCRNEGNVQLGMTNHMTGA